MKLHTRRLIYLTFIGLFLTIVPALVLYATGYRYNFKKNVLEKTGILVIESKPRNAEVTINDKFRGDTPLRLSRMLPQTYQVTVAKDGYHAWQKELTVASNLTTFQQNIVLFKESLATLNREGAINIFIAAPNRRIILYSLIKNNTIEELHSLNLTTGSDELIQTFNRQTYNQLEFVDWAPSGQQALIREVVGDFYAYHIIDLAARESKELFDITRLNFDQLRWDQNSDNLLYGLQRSALHRINLLTNLTTALLSTHITNYQVRGNTIYYITQVASESFLYRATIDSFEATEEKIKLPSPSEYTLQPAPDSLLILLDKKNDDLFIITTDAFSAGDIDATVFLQAQAKDITWSADFSQLIYYTDFELWTFNRTSRQTALINRYGQVIEKAIWYPGNSYVIYQNNNTLRATETNPLGIKNDIALSQLNQISNIIIDVSGNNIYFVGSVGSRSGIYQITIQ